MAESLLMYLRGRGPKIYLEIPILIILLWFLYSIRRRGVERRLELNLNVNWLGGISKVSIFFKCSLSFTGSRMFIKFLYKNSQNHNQFHSGSTCETVCLCLLLLWIPPLAGSLHFQCIYVAATNTS